MFDYKKLRVSALSGRYVTIEYHKERNDNAYLSDILCVFIDNSDGYDLLPNQLDGRDIVVEGVDDV